MEPDPIDEVEQTWYEYNGQSYATFEEMEKARIKAEETIPQLEKDVAAISFLKSQKVNIKNVIQNKMDELEKNSNGGVKADYGKLKWTLVPWESLEDTVRVLMMGAEKYNDDNWMKVERRRYVDAMMRHITQWMNGEAIDSESGLPHLAHAQCNMLFLNYLYGKEPFSRSE